MKIIYKQKTTSTNEDCKELIKENYIEDDYCIITSEQSAGKGSKGRTFYSPKDTGLYFSYLVNNSNNKIKNLNSELITPKVSVCVHKTIKKLFNINLSIKWINDLYFNKKKVCGILVESVDFPKHIIIGIGINMIKPDFIPEDLKNIISYLFETENDLIMAYNKNNAENEQQNELLNIYINIINEIYNELTKILQDEKIPYEYYENCFTKNEIPKDILLKIKNV